MAKYGEGDKRWIVIDRPETDCFEWSKTLLSNLLTNQAIRNDNEGLFIKTENIDLQGEAYVNVREGKIWCDLCLIIDWTGELKGESGDKLADTSGSVTVTYRRNPHPLLGIIPVCEERFYGCFRDPVQAFVWKKFRVYVDAMDKGGPAKDELEVNKVSIESIKIDDYKLMDGDYCMLDNDMLTEENGWKDVTNLELQEGKWRFASWQDGLYSTALVFLFGVVFAILGVFAHLHFGFGGANTALNFGLFIYWLMYVDRRRQFVRSMCVLAAAFCFGAIASRYYGN